ncbi:lactate/malate family dehydrogenase [Mesomycoplasma dispar]|uniref:Lactate dehydrogenase n=1 Tax=Mesomycoplasma dispar TaxID=86660 RepID=A0ABM6PRA3_9BACT|nr:lactate dehydrogenase [Mesomycoplasma dispar]ATP59731.1 lactate dehydrogenase [Mesomycoplasma dispar]
MIIGFIGITNTSINLISNLILANTNVDFFIVDNNYSRVNQIIDEFRSLIDFGNYQNKISFEDYQSLEKADILIIDPNQNLVPGMSLADLGIENADAMYKISYLVRQSNFNGISFILGYPNAILCKIFSSASGLVPKKVFGLGNILENIHFNLLFKKLELGDNFGDEFFILGDLGHNFLVSKKIQAKNLDEEKIGIVNKFLEGINQSSIEKTIRKTAEHWLIASVLTEIFLDIFNEKQNFFLLNSWVESFYHLKNDFFSLPVKISLSGQIETKNIQLNENDQQKFLQFIWKKNDLNNLINKYLNIK